MRQVTCDGCGFPEDLETPQKKRKIKQIEIVVTEDHRFPEGHHKYQADLCENCIGKCLHNYFKIRAEGSLDLPAFLEPAGSRRASQKEQRRVPVR